MKMGCRYRFVLGVLTPLTCWAAMGPPTAHAKNAGEMLQSLRAGHPRLIALDSDMNRVRELVRTNDRAKELLAAIRREGERLLDAPTVEFKIVGPRLLTQSRRCLAKVYTLAFLYRLDGDRRFAERARKELLAAAAFPHWNPSHFLDTAEMTHAFGIGYDWLYEALGDDRETIRAALIEKGLKPTAEAYTGAKYGWWHRCTHNWNQVCNGGATIGALAVADEEPELAAFILDQALESIPRALASLAPDGAWNEGPGYWHYAMRYTVCFLSALDTAMGTDAGLLQTKGLADTGSFRMHSGGPLNRTFNYADGGDKLGSAPLMHWLSRKYDRPLYAWHQRATGRGAHPLDLVWFDPRGAGPKADGTPLDAYYRKTEVTFFRSAWEDPRALYVGFKGGDNRANHSHLDLGTFVLDALGHRWAVDLGPDNYNLPGYFGKKRFTYYRLRTESHNTLLINEKNQVRDAKAAIVAFRSTPARAYAVADLSAAYKPETARVMRGVALLDRAHVLVQDEVEAPEAVEIIWGMVTPAKTKITGNRAVLSMDDESLHATILSPDDAVFETISANPPKPQRQQPNMQKLAVRLPGRTTEVRIVVLLSPAPPGKKTPPFTPAIRPLSEWIAQATRP